MMCPSKEFQLLIAPDRLTDDGLKRLHTGKRSTIAWREGEFWRVCRWAAGNETTELLSVRWEIFDDWDETGSQQQRGLLATLGEMEPLDDEDSMLDVDEGGQTQ